MTRPESISLRELVNEAVVNRLKSSSFFSKLGRTIFVAGAAAVAGVCQYITWPDNTDPTVSQVVGICATIVVFLAALISIFADSDSGDQIRAAQEALFRAENLKERLEQVQLEFPDLESAASLQSATSLFRDHLESACAQSVNLEVFLSSMVTLVKRTLPDAARFTYGDPWTICLYRAQPMASEPGKYELRLVEHLRSIQCEKSEARIWPEGKGVSGVAFSNNAEMVIPDMMEASAQALYNSAGNGRSYDLDRYRSMAVVPISVQGLARPWGVVAATSSFVDHFDGNSDPGLQPVEAIRALAKYAALAVAIYGLKDPKLSDAMPSGGV